MKLIEILFPQNIKERNVFNSELKFKRRSNRRPEVLRNYTNVGTDNFSYYHRTVRKKKRPKI